MFVFSKQHAFQGYQNIQQILVFPNAIVKELFDREMLDRQDKAKEIGLDSIKDVSDSNAGAVYKLRAIKGLRSDACESWQIQICCCMTGKIIYRDELSFTASYQALECVKKHLLYEISKAFHTSVPLTGE